MLALVIAISLLVLLALTGANLLVENTTSDELSKMGIEKKL